MVWSWLNSSNLGMYALRIDGKKNTKKVKGIKSNIVKSITFIISKSITFTRDTCKTKLKAVLHKIQIARGVHDIRNENRSKSVR